MIKKKAISEVSDKRVHSRNSTCHRINAVRERKSQICCCCCSVDFFSLSYIIIYNIFTLILSFFFEHFCKFSCGHFRLTYPNDKSLLIRAIWNNHISNLLSVVPVDRRTIFLISYIDENKNRKFLFILFWTIFQKINKQNYHFCHRNRKFEKSIKKFNHFVIAVLFMQISHWEKKKNNKFIHFSKHKQLYWIVFSKRI